MYKNDNIPSTISTNIHRLNNQVVDGILNKQPPKIINIASSSLKKENKKIEELVIQLEQIVKGSKFSIKDEYYEKLEKIGNYTFTIPSDLEADDRYYLNSLEAISDEVYVSLLVTDSKSVDHLVALLYGKESGEWKLFGIYSGQYSAQGLNAIVLYQKALELDKKGYLIPAFLYEKLAINLLRPVQFFQYDKEREIQKYGDDLAKRVNEKFYWPIKLDSMQTKPEVISIDVVSVAEGGLMPIIPYVSSVDLNDPEKLKLEAEEMTNILGNMFPGLLPNFNNIAFRAYSEQPINPQKQYSYYGTVIDITKWK